MTDKYICANEFQTDRITGNGVNRDKMIIIHDFMQKTDRGVIVNNKADYVLCFGWPNQEDKLDTLVSVCKELTYIPFLITGSELMGKKFHDVPNMTYVGDLSGRQLDSMLENASFALYPPGWYEKCPFSVVASQSLGVPVIAPDCTNSLELIEQEETGLLYEEGNRQSLKNAIFRLWSDSDARNHIKEKCLEGSCEGETGHHADKIINFYEQLV